VLARECTRALPRPLRTRTTQPVAAVSTMYACSCPVRCRGSEACLAGLSRLHKVLLELSRLGLPGLMCYAGRHLQACFTELHAKT